MATYSLNDGQGNEYLLEVRPRPRKHKAVILDLYAAERVPGRKRLRPFRKVESLALHVSDRTGNLQFTD